MPSETPHKPFTSIEDINNYMLQHKDVGRLYRSRTADGDVGKAVFLFFDDETEQLCEQLGLEICFPKASLRRMVDDKISATRIADRAGIASVPNVLAKVENFAQLQEASKNLGDQLVIQTAFGDSGHTTFFISDESDYRKYAEEIAREPEVKIMKRIRCRGAAQEAASQDMAPSSGRS